MINLLLLFIMIIAISEGIKLENIKGNAKDFIKSFKKDLGQEGDFWWTQLNWFYLILALPAIIVYYPFYYAYCTFVNFITPNNNIEICEA